MTIATKPRHAPQAHFPVVDDVLHIGGMPLTRLAQRVGRTPFFAYDRALCTQRVRELRAQLPQGVLLHYSIKANPMPALVQHMAGLVDGLDVASGAEMKIALDAGMAAQRISFAGPGKLEAELSQAVAAGVCLNVESERELNALARIGDALGIVPRIAVRVNPEFELKSSGMRMGGGAKPFGVDAEAVPQLLRAAAALAIDFQGFHIFAGSQSLRPDAIVEAQARSIELALRLADAAPQPVRQVNIGGGFGIPYFPARNGWTWRRSARIWRPGSKSWAPPCRRRGWRWSWAATWSASAGFMSPASSIARSRAVKCSWSWMAACTITWRRPAIWARSSARTTRLPWATAWRRSTAAPPARRARYARRSTFSPTGLELAHAQVGDLIVVFQSGAYGPTASPGFFLGHPAALEVLV